ASPYTLNTLECRHTFCALCLISWAFKNIDEDSWGSIIECPSCDASVVHVSATGPRSPDSFPFIVNSLVAVILQCHITLLRDAANVELSLVDATDRLTRNRVPAVLDWGFDMPSLVALRERER
ncbi:hypothetical protein OH76DRAFT_1362549, partial [Lentinus brumalis]